jgi:hypothetical protein
MPLFKDFLLKFFSIEVKILNQVQRSKSHRRIRGLLNAAGEGIFEKDIVRRKREVDVPTKKV